MFKRILKIIVLAFIYQLAKFGDFMICGLKDIFKNASYLMYVTDLVNHGMVKSTKTWISSEQNIIFLQKKILNLCFRWHILRSYHFLAEVTFKHNECSDPSKNYLTDMKDIFSLTNFIKELTSLKLQNSTLSHVILTNRPRSFMKSQSFGAGLCDCHKLNCSILRTSCNKLPLKL